jgi:hypothetical protein
MKANDLYFNILNSFWYEGNSTIIKAVRNRYRLVLSRAIDIIIDKEYKSITISLSEYIKELNKNGFTVEDAEAGLVLYMLIKHLWTSTEEIILDFENVNYKEFCYLIDDCLERLSYEYGKFLKEHVKTINVPDKVVSVIGSIKYNTVIENAMLSYKDNMLAYEEDNSDNN